MVRRDGIDSEHLSHQPGELWPVSVRLCPRDGRSSYAYLHGDSKRALDAVFVMDPGLRRCFQRIASSPTGAIHLPSCKELWISIFYPHNHHTIMAGIFPKEKQIQRTDNYRFLFTCHSYVRLGKVSFQHGAKSKIRATSHDEILFQFQCTLLVPYETLAPFRSPIRLSIRPALLARVIQPFATLVAWQLSPVLITDVSNDLHQIS